MSQSIKTKVEGLILHKIPFRERDLILRLLLRSGKSLSVLCYGGMGGGKKNKGSLLDLGHLMSFELQEAKGRGEIKSDLFQAKEWTLKWQPRHIRYDHKAFYLQAFFLEMMSKIASSDSLDPDLKKDVEHEGLFRVLSNALFYLDDSLFKKTFQWKTHAGLFLVKLICEMGVMPRMSNCFFCETNLMEFRHLPLKLLFDEGAFSCASCCDIESNQRALYENLLSAKNSLYSEYTQLRPFEEAMLKNLWNYFSFQFHLSEKDFKTSGVVFS